MTSLRVAVWSAVALACVAGAFFGGYYLRPDDGPKRPPRISFIAAAPDDFHQAAIAGARAAAEQFAAELRVHVPRDGADQSSMLAVLNGDQVDGVVISPRAPRGQTRILSLLATEVPVVTYDNDAPESLRHCYIGTDNYSGGQMCAQLVKDALPDGGEVAVLIGDVDRDNARLRRLGLIDTLLARGRSEESRVDPLDRALEGEGFTIVGTYLDDHDEGRCRENADRLLTEHPDLDLMVGLYGYTAPVCLEAIEAAGREDEVRVVGFDQYEATLEGVESGRVVGTIVQDPYGYGFQSVRLLTEWWRDPFVAPASGSSAPMLMPCRAVVGDNVSEYRKQLAAHVAAGAEG